MLDIYKIGKIQYRKIKYYFTHKKLVDLQKKIIKYHANSSDKEICGVVNYLKHNKLTMFPYDFEKGYKSDEYEAFFDRDKQMFYVLREDKKLYLKKSVDTVEKAKELYSNILREQDENSPHRYITNSVRCAVKNGIVVEVGTAEGMFTLDAIEFAQEAYLFECEEEWREALEATFEPWKEKVFIIQAFVSNKNSGDKVTLDSYLKNKEVSILKMDVEGEEVKVLQGAKKILQNSPNIELIVTCYHNQEDEQSIRKQLEGYTVNASQGYVIFFYDENLQAPYLRRCILHAKKKYDE